MDFIKLASNSGTGIEVTVLVLVPVSTFLEQYLALLITFIKTINKTFANNVAVKPLESEMACHGYHVGLRPFLQKLLHPGLDLATE